MKSCTFILHCSICILVLPLGPDAFAQTFSVHAASSAPNSSPWTTRIANIAGGSRPDIVAAPESGRLVWLKNATASSPPPGYPTNWQDYTIQPDGGAAGWTFFSWDIHLKDMDNDGDMDVVGGAWGPNPAGGARPEHVCWWEHPGIATVQTVTSWTRHVIYTWNNGPNTMTLRWAEPADIDADGDLDVACAGQTSFFWLRNTSGSYTFQNLTLAAVEGTCAHPCQLDLDAPLEIVCTEWTTGGNLSRVTSYGGGPFDSTGLGGYSWCAEDLDWDGDGDNDVFVSGAVGRWYRNDGINGFTKINTLSANGCYCRKGDVNGDGKVDFVCSGNRWFRNLGGGTFTAETLNSASGQPLSLFTRQIDVADLNGDLKRDIAIAPAGTNGTAWLKQN